jgi:hypothetical protein
MTDTQSYMLAFFLFWALLIFVKGIAGWRHNKWLNTLIVPEGQELTIKTENLGLGVGYRAYLKPAGVYAQDYGSPEMAGRKAIATYLLTQNTNYHIEQAEKKLRGH